MFGRRNRKLSWEEHIETTCNKTSAGIWAIGRVKPYVPVDTLEIIYKNLVQPYFDYCSPLWDNCGKLLQDKLQKFQSRTARLITGASYDLRSVDFLYALSWETLDVKRSCTKSVFMYKILSNYTSPNLKESFSRRNECRNIYNHWNNETDLALPKPKTEFLKKSLKK